MKSEQNCSSKSTDPSSRNRRTALAPLKCSSFELLGWRPSLLGWTYRLGWRPSLVGWRPSLTVFHYTFELLALRFFVLTDDRAVFLLHPARCEMNGCCEFRAFVQS